MMQRALSTFQTGIRCARVQTIVVISVACICLVFATVWLLFALGARQQRRARVPDEKKSSPTEFARAVVPDIPDLKPSRFLNTQADASYVGLRACIACHPGEHESYLLTAHSRALGDMGDSGEPPDGNFAHARSSLAYSVAHRGQQVRHHVELKDETGEIVGQSDFPIRYHIGSGEHSRSYLLQDEEFLFESPMTWYADRQKWGLSPGYDGPLPIGFDRIVDKGCLFCHAGRIETVNDNRFRPRIVEASIGCESCHGPGSLHVARGRKNPEPSATRTEDLTIVNPARLDRASAEQICSYCHLRGQASSSIRGRKQTDFRPGLDLSDFRIDFFDRHTDGEMTVTGHVQQMHSSKCYQASPNMTCMTCHDPHDRPASDKKIEYFRQRCLECHTDSCRMEADKRLKQQPDDNCISCHMPRGRTDIPHIAFTHHRVGIHAESPQAVSKRDALPQLVPGVTLDKFSAADQQRLLGLAYVEFSEKQSPEIAQRCRQTGRQLLQRAFSQGIHDIHTLSTLSGLEMELGDPQTAISFAQAALKEPNADSGGHENARFVLANAWLEQNELAKAEAEMQAVIANRRRTADWLLLAEIRHKRNDLAGEIEALRAAEKLNPYQPRVQHLLSLALEAVDQTEEAKAHRQLEQRLRGILEKSR